MSSSFLSMATRFHGNGGNRIIQYDLSRLLDSPIPEFHGNRLHFFGKQYLDLDAIRVYVVIIKS